MRWMPLGLLLGMLMMPTAAQAATVPVPYSVVVQPTISGNPDAPRVGETLTAISAVYNRFPTSVGYHWQRCAPGQAFVDCANAGNGRSYTLQPADVGSYMVVAEPGHDASGQIAVGISPATPAVTDGQPVRSAPEPPPVPLSYPTVSGSWYLGDTLIATPGTWTAGGYTPSYQWLRCGLNTCEEIAGATGLTYTITPEDLHFIITMRSAATAAGGTAYAMAQLNHVGAKLPATRQLLRQALDLPDVSARWLLKHGPRPKFVCPAAGRVSVTWTTRHGGVLLGRGRAACGPGHPTVKVPFLFTRRGRKLLRRVGKPPFWMTAAFAPADHGPPTTFRWPMQLAD
jgi:hypothetical protein